MWVDMCTGDRIIYIDRNDKNLLIKYFIYINLLNDIIAQNYIYSMYTYV